MQKPAAISCYLLLRPHVQEDARISSHSRTPTAENRPTKHYYIHLQASYTEANRLPRCTKITEPSRESIISLTYKAIEETRR